MTLSDIKRSEQRLGDLARPLLNGLSMRRSPSRSENRRAHKVTWGLRIAVLVREAVFFACVSALFFVLLPGLAAAAAPAANAASARHSNKLDARLQQRTADPGESDVIVEFNDDREALKVVTSFGRPGRKLGILKGFSAKVSNRALARLAAHDQVRRVSWDRPVSVLNGRTAITTGARAVQQLSGYTGAGVGVAVIDSGITPWHDDLTSAQTYTWTYPVYTYVTDPVTGLQTISSTTYVNDTYTYYGGQRVVHFADFVAGNNLHPHDGFGHGTHVAGVIAGNGFDSEGERAGIAPGASIIALKALDDEGQGRISNIIAAIDYAISIKNTYNIRVLNLSLGAGVYESYETDPLTLAAKRAVEADIVVVAASGNLGRAKDGQPQYGAVTAPANAPWVLTVGGSSTEGTTARADDIMASYSSRGPTMYDYGAKPDLVAPGAGTVSLSNPNSLLYATRPNLLLAGSDPSLSYLPYISLTGTSMSAPVVSGTVALMLEANPNLTPNLVKAILQFTSQVYPGYDWLTQGAGFLNSRGAVQLAEYFTEAVLGSHYPDMTGWSQHIFWGNHRVSGGVLTPGGTAWGTNVVWGNVYTPSGQNVVWGENCDQNPCDNVVWGNNIVWGESVGDGDNVVWGNTDSDNVVWGNADNGNVVWRNGDSDKVVWGNSGDDNVVWGNHCQGDDCDNVVWGNGDDDNVVWGNCTDGDGNGNCDNVVWGNCADDNHDGQCDNVVWGNTNNDNVVWGNREGDNVVWGNSLDAVIFGDEGADVSGFDASVWDDLFRSSAALLTSGGSR